MLRTKNIIKQSDTSNGTGISVIAAGTVIEGEVTMPGDLRLDGTILGNINSNAKVMMGEHGKIKGNVTTRSSGIKGEFEGELKVSEKLHIHSSARIEGTIHTKTLIVENGAQIIGNCNVGTVQSAAPIEIPEPETQPNRLFDCQIAELFAVIYSIKQFNNQTIKQFNNQ